MTRLNEQQTADVVAAAAAGDRRAWEQLVDAYSGLVWAVTRNHRISATDASDVSQTTWLRLVEHIDRLNDPTRVGAWLATTARRECLRVIGQSRRTTPVGTDEELEDRAAPPLDVDAALLSLEEQGQVERAMSRLSGRCQELLLLLMSDPPPTYEEVSMILDMPVGSIGPTRGRCLRRLEQELAAEGIEHARRDILLR